MPQASDELRAEMDRRFGDPVDSTGPEKYLKDHDWTLHRDWTWSKPGFDQGNMPREEFDCALFLIHEWDYGGVRDLRHLPARTKQQTELERQLWMLVVHIESQIQTPCGSDDGPRGALYSNKAYEKCARFVSKQIPNLLKAADNDKP